MNKSNFMTLILSNIISIESLKKAASCSPVLSQSKDIEAPLRLHYCHNIRTISQAARDERLQIAAAVLQASDVPAEHSTSPTVS